MEDLLRKDILKIIEFFPKVKKREVPAEVIGKLVMDGLRQIDEVAYVRFASVYRRFQEATDFVQEVRKLGGRE